MRLSAMLAVLLNTGVAAQLDSWSPVSVPNEEGWKGGKGFGWYRAYVTVPADWEGSRLLLMVEAISDVDEGFFNGHKIGANGSMPPLFGNPSSSVRRPFVIEPDQIRYGKSNLIAWRVFSKGGKGGILSGPVHLSRADDAIDLSGTWLFRSGDVPAWARWGEHPASEAEAFATRAGKQRAGHRGIIPADREWRGRMLATVAKHFEGNQNPYARADDKGHPAPPAKAESRFRPGRDLEVETVLSEPLVRQPLYLDFDARGRLWVVQYIQYPSPAGLQVLTWDKHLRKVFDRVPPPPPFTSPGHRKFTGQDKITIHEDTDGDGVFDKHKTFLDGLNMVTSLAHGDGGVWVLHPPYLLFFPDRDGDDKPDGKPVIHLSGFNLEDTHSISNSLKFGPDGWLYGCTGSTVTARVRVHLDPEAPRHAFLGQNIWRYHPDLTRFELFAEGGWNNFGVDFDDQGRLYSGTNGTQQAVHFVQGGYYQKSFGKHGPHTNPYSFGHFFGMPIDGEKTRLVHQWLRYSSGAIPGLQDRLVGPNSLGNRIHAIRMVENGSTFKTVEEEKPLQTDDKWFRPVHCAVGPDGAIYVADFYDARITHVDPRDNWDRSNGRVHRIRSKNARPGRPRDLRSFSSSDLVALLGDQNQWARRTARRLLSQRRDANTTALLLKTMRDEAAPQLALEAFSTLSAGGMLQPPVVAVALRHPDPFVRAAAIRSAGDLPRLASNEVVPLLRELCVREMHPEVVSQLASSAQLIGASHAKLMISELAKRAEFADDPFIPQQLWWAMESLVTRAPELAAELLDYSGFWDAPLFEKTLRERIGRRYMAERSTGSLQMCSRLLRKAAGTKHLDSLIRGMEKALEGTSLEPVPGELDAALANIWKNHPVTDDLIRFSLRMKSPRALAAARPLLRNPGTPVAQRLAFIKALGELADSSSEKVFLSLFADTRESAEIRLAALSALRRYAGAEIPQTILACYPELQGPLRQTAQSLLAARPGWALKLLEAVDHGKIDRSSIGLDSVLLMATYKEERTQSLLRRHWGKLRKPDKEKGQRILAIKAILGSSTPGGSVEHGRRLFATKCGLCHKFGSEGQEIGPDLTGYEMDNLDYLIPAIVDPNLGIREGYELATLTLRPKDNTPSAVLTGFLRGADERTVTIKDLAGNKTVVARSDLAGESRVPVSVMPEGLLDGLSPDEIRSLVAYLQAGR
ncbi:MAG: dehydrogenase [Verrucomicrobiaceae bacterium]|nr:dehydrogenase [Verrucomicrobiaceae bacterium]